VCGDRVEKMGLADSRLTGDQRHPCSPTRHGVELTPQRRELALSADQQWFRTYDNLLHPEGS
jgi:hypothetical protein